VKEPAQLDEKILAMNEALLLGSVRQHELTEAAGALNSQLRAEIEEHQRAKQALRASEESYRGMFAAAPMAVLSCDRDGLIRSYNDLAVKLWQREPVRGVEKYSGAVKLWLPDGTWLPHEQCPMAQVLRTGMPLHNVELLIERLDGTRLPILMSVAPITGMEGELTGAIASFIDIAARQLTEWNLTFLASISQDLVRLSGIQEITEIIAAKIGAYLHLTRCVLVTINEEDDEAVVVQDWHREDLPGILGAQRISDFITPEVSQAAQKGKITVVRDVATDPRVNPVPFAALKAASFVCVPIAPEGHWRFALVLQRSTTYDWREDEIELMRELAGRIWTRLEHARAEEALREAQERLKFTLDSAQVGDWDLDLADNTVRRSLRHDQAFGYAEPVPKWSFEIFLQHVHADDRAEVDRKFHVAVREKKDWHIECRVIWPDGSVHWIAEHGSIYRTPEGQPTRMLGIVFDITERRMMEEDLVARARELARADRSKDEFLAMLAHELRNPLAAVRNAAEILRTTEAGAAAGEMAQGILNRQIENMTRMIDDLLDVSRITKGKIELKKAEVTLDTIVNAAANLALPGIKGRDQHLAVTLPAEPIYLEADATRLEQVFGNLLGNACKYSDKGAHIALIAERAAPRNEMPPEVIVRVLDDGIGIAPELLPHVFGLFVQSTRALDRAHGGLGIGLTVVQRLVNLHGGSVEAHSEGPGHGSEFIVHLPILPGPTAAAPPVVLPARDVPRRILVVDDNEDSARSMAALQRMRGHETLTVFNGPDAIAAAAEFAPEAVLLDIGLPGMDGYEVARRLRAVPAHAGTFIVAMTGYDTHPDRDRALQAGFDEYLVKPIDSAKLREWLRHRPTHVNGA